MILPKGPGRVPAPEPIGPGAGYLDRAAAFLAAGKKEEARAAASEAALHSTGLVPALELYARLSDELGYSDDAITAFRRLIMPDSEMCLRRLVDYEALAGNVRRADFYRNRLAALTKG